VAAAARLLGAAGRVVLRIEVEDHVLAGEVLEGHLLAVCVGERERRRCLAFLDGHRDSSRTCASDCRVLCTRCQGGAYGPRASDSARLQSSSAPPPRTSVAEAYARNTARSPRASATRPPSGQAQAMVALRTRLCAESTVARRLLSMRRFT